MQFGYDARPSFWQEVKSNSHLVIAAVGTAALLGVAGTALWLAMPAGDRQAFAQMAQPAPVVEPAAKAEPVEAKAASQPALASIEPTAPTKTTPKADAVAVPKMASVEEDLAALPANDPRWSGSTHKQARAPAESAEQANREAASPSTATAKAAGASAPVPTPDQAAAVAAYQPAQDEPAAQAAPEEQVPVHPKPDKAETAAIPVAKPAEPAEPAANESATQPGRILRDVTLRSGPKKGAAAIGTIPARTAVEVMSCQSWCQVVYKGKRGWIYKSFLDSKANRNSGAGDPVKTQSIDTKPPPAPAKVEKKVVPDPLDARRASGFGHT
jgi:hypothetical protein